MFGSTVVEVAIGLIFVYILLSLLCSAINELLAQIFHLRSKTLEKGIERLLTDQSIRDAFYSHPLVQSLGSKKPGAGKGKPSYIPSRVFATALLDTLAPDDAKPAGGGFSEMRKVIEDIEIPDLKKALRALFDAAEGKLDGARKNVENWFDDTMERVSGWYKRK